MPWAWWIPLESKPGRPLHKHSLCLQEDVGELYNCSLSNPQVGAARSLGLIVCMYSVFEYLNYLYEAIQ